MVELERAEELSDDLVLGLDSLADFQVVLRGEGLLDLGNLL